jgi:hypothetical protein
MEMRWVTRKNASVWPPVDVTPEAAGLEAIAHGFAVVHGEDDQRKTALARAQKAG